MARSTIAAVGVAREVEHALMRIGEAPGKYPITRFGRRRFVLLNNPYDVVYRIVGSDLELVAVAHHARKPAYGRDR